jgi:hypothetical protein
LQAYWITEKRLTWEYSIIVIFVVAAADNEETATNTLATTAATPDTLDPED